MLHMVPRRPSPVRYILALSLATALGGAAAVTARADSPATEPAPLALLQTDATNLGYSPVLANDKQSFSIAWTGDYNYKLHFQLSRDASIAYVYVNIGDFTPEQLGKLDFIKLLQENDLGNFFFSMEKSGTGQTLYANAIIPISGLTQQQLRTILQGVSDKLSDTAAVWDTSQWK